MVLRPFKKLIILIIVVSTLLVVFATSRAAFNPQMNYQGKLTDSNSLAVADGAYDVVFKLYATASSSVPIWTESWTSAALWTETGTITVAKDSADCGGSGFTKITFTNQTNKSSLAAGQYLWNVTKKETAAITSTVLASDYVCIANSYTDWVNGDTLTNRVVTKNGQFSVMMGTLTNLSGVNFNQELWLGVTVGADSEMIPRKKIGAAAAAFEAAKLEGHTWAAPGAIGSSTSSTAIFTTLATTATTTFAGNVGIGVAVPGTKLDVRGGIAAGTNGTEFTVSAAGLVTGGTYNKVAITVPASGATLTIADGKTLTANANFTLAGTDGTQLSLAGNFTTSGAYATTLIATDTTSVTLPTSGTLATLAGSESLTNKKLGSLTTNGFVKTSGSDGTLSVDTNTYLTSYTETDPIVKAINGMVKSNGSTISAATAGTDYSAGTSALATGILKSTTSTGALSIAAGGDINTTFGSQTANYFYAAPSGGAGNPSFRAIADADIPDTITLTNITQIGTRDHGSLTGLTDDDHSIYALLAGRSSGQTLIGGTAATDDLILRTTGGVGAIGADMIFQTGNNGGTEAMRILYDGKVGIGTTGPVTRLDIRSGNALTQSWGNVGISSTDSAAIDLGGQLDFGGSYTGTTVTYFASVAGRKETGTAGELGGYLQFSTRNNATTLNAERMRIDSSGNVGIGTTAPEARLDVIAGAGSAAQVYAGQFGNAGDLNEVGDGNLVGLDSAGYTQIGSLLHASGNYGLTFNTYASGTGTTEKMRILGNGNVGIGTTAPGAVLEINGRIRSFSSTDAHIDIGEDVNNRFAVDWDETNDLTTLQTIVGNVNTGILSLQPSGGNVGIGTTNPITLLHISNASATDVEALRLDSSGASGSVQGKTYLGFNHWASGTYPSARIGVEETDLADYDASLVFQTRSSDSDSLPTTKMTITEGGNVGIGAADPTSLFSVGASSQFQVNSSGDIVKLKNLTYAWPSAHTANGVLVNNGSGTLSWATVGAANITANSLDFAQFQDTLDLDASLTLNQGTNTWAHNYTGTTATGFNYTANSLTSGTGMLLSSSSITSGNLFKVDYTNAADTSAFTGNLGLFSLASTWTGASSPANSGNMLEAARSITMNSTGYTNTISGAVLRISDAATLTAGAFSHTANALEVAQGYTSNSGSALNVTTAGTGFAFRANDDGTLTDTTPFVITAAGNVGIGGAAPRGLLEVISGTANTNADGAREFTVVGPNYAIGQSGNVTIATNDAQAADMGGSIIFGGRYVDSSTTEAHWASIKSGKYDGTSGHYGGYLSFATRLHGSGMAEHMRVDSGGNIGIGNTDPGARLQVTSSAQVSAPTAGVASGSMALLSTTNLFGWYSGVSSNGDVWMQAQRNDGGTTLYDILLNPIGGNVGIGTTSPAQLLDVYGATSPGIKLNSATGVGYLGMPTAASGWSSIATANDFVVRADTEDLILTARNASGAIRFSTAATDTEKMTILSGGNVGIGTAVPGHELDVVGSIRANGADARLGVGASDILTRVAGYFTPTFTDTASNVYGIHLTSTVNGSNNNYYGFYDALSVGAGATITNRYGMIINNPSGTGAITNNYGLYINSQTKGGTLNYSIYSAGGANYFAGNTGIGTNDPGATLDVVGNIFLGPSGRTNLTTNATGLLVDATNDADYDFLVYEGTSYIPTIKLGYGGTAMLSSYDTNEGMTINANGSGIIDIMSSGTGDVDVDSGTLYVDNSADSVGIGVTAPSSLLDLQKAGTAKAITSILEITNSGNAADMDGTGGGLLFNQYYYDAVTPAVADAARIGTFTETDWTSTASTQDASIVFQTSLDGTLAEKARISASGYLGVGTASPQYKVDVAGRVSMTGGTGVGWNVFNVGTTESGNYEIMRGVWSSNVYYFQSIAGGTGTARDVEFADKDGYAWLYLKQGGKVGINDSTSVASANLPAGSLVMGNGALCVDNGGDNCDDGARTAGRLYIDNVTPVDIDLAENYPVLDETIEAGDLVAVDSQINKLCAETKDGLDGGKICIRWEDGNVPFVAKADGNKTILGVISTKPGILLGGWQNNDLIDYKKVPVTLSGRIPVKVNLEGGAIEAGDKISLSTIPGVGRKAAPGQSTVGIALDDYNRDGVGKIVVFVNLDSASSDLDNLKVQLDAAGILAANFSATSTDDFVENHSGFWTVIQKVLVKLGLTLQDGVASLKEVVTSKFTAQTARINQLEMVDKATGEVYCTWIENGVWQKTFGACTAATSAPVAAPSGGSTSVPVPATTTEVSSGATTTVPGAATTTQPTDTNAVTSAPVADSTAAAAAVEEAVSGSSTSLPVPAPVAESSLVAPSPPADSGSLTLPPNG